MKKLGNIALMTAASLVAATAFAAGPPVTASSTASATISNPVTLSTAGDGLEFGGWDIVYDGVGGPAVACTIRVNPDDSANPSVGTGGGVVNTPAASSCASTSPIAHDDYWLITGSPTFAVTINNGPTIPTSIGRTSGPACIGDTSIPVGSWEQASGGAATGSAYPGAEVVGANGQAYYSSGATISPSTRQCPGTYSVSYDNTVNYT